MAALMSSAAVSRVTAPRAKLGGRVTARAAPTGMKVALRCVDFGESETSHVYGRRERIRARVETRAARGRLVRARGGITPPALRSRRPARAPAPSFPRAPPRPLRQKNKHDALDRRTTRSTAPPSPLRPRRGSVALKPARSVARVARDTTARRRHPRPRGPPRGSPPRRGPSPRRRPALHGGPRNDLAEGRRRGPSTATSRTT